MDINKLNPWNWFSDEEGQARNLPVKRNASQDYSPMSQLHQEIDRLFGNVYRGFGWGRMVDLDDDLPRIRVDVSSTDKEYTITAEIPGVDEVDVNLELAHDGTLIIRGEKKQEKEQQDSDFYRVERSYGSFHRTLSLPEDANQENINASFKNGVLTITLPRKAATQIPVRRIEINQAA